MNEGIDTLLRLIREANPIGFCPDISALNLGDLSDPRFEQFTIMGKENHRLKTYLAILLMRAMRDFTDTDSGVYKSHNAVDAIVKICRSERDLRKRVRAQIRRTLNSPRWQYDSPIEEIWVCVYCGSKVRNDEEGLARMEHMYTHDGALPVEADDGFPFSSAQVSVVRGHLLGCLCGLVRTNSWNTHRSFFERELDQQQLESLENEVLSCGDALRFYANFDWDYELKKNKPGTY